MFGSRETFFLDTRLSQTPLAVHGCGGCGNSSDTATRVVLLCDAGIDYPFYLRDLICRNAGFFSMLSYHIFAWRDVHAVELVIGNIALHPLNFRTESL